MNTTELIKYIENGHADKVFCELYGDNTVTAMKARYIKAVREFALLYGKDREVSAFSVPGRTEVAGNHTDHNHGCVIAASVNLDIIAIASAHRDYIISVKSEGFPADTVSLDDYNVPNKQKFSTSASIIAGMCAGFLKNGHSVGGFDAYTTSNVLKGSGLSSSAAFEDMIGNIENYFYNGGQVDSVEIAKIAQYAENEFFGKPCGLMDQIACAVGGIVAIDFEVPNSPVIERIDFDFNAENYNLCIVDTGGNHADLTPDYAAVPSEMKAVANFFGKKYLREIDREIVEQNIKSLREAVGDRAILRAFHFFDENKRVTLAKSALLENNLDKFFENIIESGRSSFCYLQNVYTNKNVSEQGLSVALCLAENFLKGKKASFRVHGGGFAGTISAFLPTSNVEEYRRIMDSAFGEGACIVLRIRGVGITKVI